MSDHKSLAEHADERAAAQYAENERIAQVNRVLRGRVTEQERELTKLRKTAGLYERLAESKPRVPSWLSPGRNTKSHTAIPSLLLTDVHFDEVVLPEQVDYVNAYNRPIALQRLRNVFERTIIVARDYISGVAYTGFQLLLGGDLLSGIIHQELLETNEATVVEGVLGVMEPLTAGIRLLAKEFKQLHIAAVVGNHGRRTLKPVAKNRAQDNFDWLVYKLIQRELAGEKHITMQVPEAPDAHVQVHQVKYLLTHGDQFKGGTGISAAYAPLLLGSHRKTRKQTAIGHPYDVMVMGHFHKSIWMPQDGLIVGGSVIGYNEFAYQQNMTPEDPQCAFWLTTPERGITVSAPIFVSRRKEEGW